MGVGRVHEGGEVCEGEGVCGDKLLGESTYQMISGGSCCQDLLDGLPLYWGSH